MCGGLGEAGTWSHVSFGMRTTWFAEIGGSCRNVCRNAGFGATTGAGARTSCTLVEAAAEVSCMLPLRAAMMDCLGSKRPVPPICSSCGSGAPVPPISPCFHANQPPETLPVHALTSVSSSEPNIT